MIRITCKDHNEWLQKRAIQGIGASEAAAVMGLSPWCTKLELWKQKTGKSKPEDLTGNAAVEQGNRLEPALRELFNALHPEYTIEYHQYDLVAQEETPWLFATLDGELLTQDGKKGVLEIKTSTPGSTANWDKWKSGVPNNYFVQVLHQLLATKYDFAILFAALFDLNGNITLRQYEFERESYVSDMEYVLNEETEFIKLVQTKTMPGTILTL